MEVEWDDLERSGFSMMVQARRPAARCIYNYTWSAFKKWATGRKTDTLKPSHKDVVMFLHEGWKQGFSGSGKWGWVTLLPANTLGDS